MARKKVGRLRLARECEYRLGLASEGVGRKSLALVGTLALLLRQNISCRFLSGQYRTQPGD